MQTRRSGVRILAGGLVALAVLVLPALAEELFGIVKSVDAPAKKVVVTEKGTLVGVEVTVNDQTVIETPKGEKVPLEKLKAGSRVHVTHDEEDVASKIVVRAPPRRASPGRRTSPGREAVRSRAAGRPAAPGRPPPAASRADQAVPPSSKIILM